MKKTMSVLIVMTVVFALFSAVILMLAPDTVPLHYNFQGEADRMGSKWELLVYPGIVAAMNVIFAVAAPKKEENENNAKLMGTLLPMTTAALMVILGVFMVKAVLVDPETAARLTGLETRIVFVILGVLIAILGNFMPKAKKNHAFGLRTPWAYASDEVWRKSQRTAGFMAVAAGLATVVGSLLLPIGWVLPVGLILLLGMSAAGIFVSRYYAAQEKKKEQK